MYRTFDSERILLVASAMLHHRNPWPFTSSSIDLPKHTARAAQHTADGLHALISGTASTRLPCHRPTVRHAVVRRSAAHHGVVRRADLLSVDPLSVVSPAAVLGAAVGHAVGHAAACRPAVLGATARDTAARRASPRCPWLPLMHMPLVPSGVPLLVVSPPTMLLPTAVSGHSYRNPSCYRPRCRRPLPTAARIDCSPTTGGWII
ncbi:hypothetical protein PHYPSEUDO_010405 [Phytophthora pseudosyringae]|uniref:Uncharacterized protein n=1 Tax=Phytophthora pseudosyringae TaxID=221518 RepID=A0A8T1VDR6_9STRA|nr:hypothetical protein PHYPSEUDO_010405 [Phytophthora pseudosyringae]